MIVPGSEGTPPVNPGPTISSVAVSQTSGKISWNAADPDGVASCTLKIDNNSISGIGGPYAAASGVNFSAPYGSLAGGTHTYTITATDLLGHSNSLTGSFSLPSPVPAGPTISGVVASTAKGKITWNAADSDGIGSVALTINGNSVSSISGPYAAASGFNYSAAMGSLAAGDYSFRITATDKLGNASTYDGQFHIDAPPANNGPTISGVVASTAKGKITWNAADSDGIGSVALTIGGNSVSSISGPYAAASGFNYSAAMGSLAAGDHSFRITATDKLGNASTYDGQFHIDAPPANNGPTISGVVASTAKGKITWNAADSDGIGSVALTIDGNSVSSINGPYAAASGFNYSAAMGSQAAGDHNYVITATDKLGNVTTYNGTFNVPVSAGPTISGVVVSQTKGKISWNANAPYDVVSCTLKIDNNTISAIGGPYAAASGVNFSASYGSLAAGTHTYTITATDKLGHSNSLTDSFVLSGPVAAGPTISGVVVSSAQSKITWNAADPDGIGSVGLTVDGAAVSGINGPYAAASGFNYSWKFGSLAAGTHNYVIRATDKLGNVSTYSGSFDNSSLNALYAGAARSALSNSAKVDWVFDLGGLTNGQSGSNNDNTDAVDAVMAAYQ